MDISENTANLKRLLQDMQHVFSTEELLGIIESQFLDDTVPLDDAIVDAAITRLLALEGKRPNMENLKERRATVMTDVFKKILILKNENDVKS